MKLQNLATYVGEAVKARPKLLYWLLGIVLLLAADGRAWAETVSITITQPTQYVNGAPLPLTEIIGTEFECVRFTPTGGNAGPCAAGIKTLNGNGTTYLFDVGVVNPRGGTFEFVARTKVNGAISANSAPAQKVFAAVAPKPPGLTVIQTTAYGIKFDWRKFRYALNDPVGTVPLGAECHKDFTLAGGYYRIERDEVSFTGRNRPAVVVAKCS